VLVILSNVMKRWNNDQIHLNTQYGIISNQIRQKTNAITPRKMAHLQLMPIMIPTADWCSCRHYTLSGPITAAIYESSVQMSKLSRINK